MERTGLSTLVREAYSAVAESPTGKHAFPVGKRFARRVGYPPAWLERIPDRSKASFAGVSNVSIFARLESGDTVLDLGCGAGLDALIAASRVGPTGKVIGLDFSPRMVRLVRRSAEELGCKNLEVLCSAAEKLPLQDQSIQVALVNGIFNLNPARAQIFEELCRVVRRGGAVYASELILKKSLSKPIKRTLENWFA